MEMSPFFVPTSTQSSMKDSSDGPRSSKDFDTNKHHSYGSDKEDEGYVLCLVHNHSSGASHLLVMDAQSPSLHVLASIKLPSRVPYGFHGFFVQEHELAKQTTGFP